MRTRRVSVVLAAALAGAVLAGGAPAPAQVAGVVDEGPVLIGADTLTYDRESGIATAAGNVELASGGRILRADAVSYDERRDLVVARGGVAMLEPSGDVLFAEYVELSDGLRNGFVSEIRVLMADDSRLVANAARRADGNRTDMSKAVFSPCRSCPDRPNRPPLWQIKAHRVVHDRSARRLDYRDAFLEVFGVPVAYTPFFSHPDPTVERRSGFLAPTYGSSSELGAKLRTPYYFDLAPHRDATLAPLYMSEEGVLLAGEYRERTHAGRLQVEGSVIHADERDENNARTGNREVRGHVEAAGAFDVDDTWRWGFAASRATDDTYLRRHELSDEDTLVSNAFVEGFRGRSHASANAYAFQGLRREDDPGETPLVLPELDYGFVGRPGPLGQRWGLAANVLGLSRNGGLDSRRLSLGLDWRLPHTSASGQVYNLLASVRGDLYHVDDVPDPSGPGDSPDELAGRLLPRLALQWRYPFIRKRGGTSQIVEPLVDVVAAPSGGNPDEIPNEDSRSFEFDDSNLFSLDRFPGLDRWEGGHRMNYGLRAGAYGAGGGYVTALIGQSLRARADRTFAENTGLEKRRSDYVGRIGISPGRLLDYTHRLRIDRDRLSIRRNEIDLTFGPQAIRVDVGYVFLSRELTADELRSREEIRVAGRARMTDHWSVTAATRRDLTDDGGTVSWGLGATYLDECFELGLLLDRSFVEDRDVQPFTDFSVRVRLRHLG